ncbi:hypothetical protein [Streptomyces collinus]
MGRATNALLAYGYNLGGSDNGWEVQETDDYGGLAVDWYDEETGDFRADVEAVLAHALPGHGLKLEEHCSDRATSYLLAVDVTTAHRGDPVVIDFADLTRTQLAGDWDDQLAAGLRALGLTPEQGAPAWLLASYADGF